MMNNNDKVLSLLGLCRRAGSLSIGFDACVEAAKRHRSYMILVAGDLSDRSFKRICETIGDSLEVLRLEALMEDFEKALGRSGGIVSVNDSGFASRIRQLVVTI